jgi:hypothetical protein
LDCISNFLKAQNTIKCPSCKSPIVEENILKNVNKSNPNAAKLTTTLSTQSLLRTTICDDGIKKKYNSNTNDFDNTFVKKTNCKNQSNNPMPNSLVYPTINVGEIYVRKINKSCEGYESVKSLLITFEIPDGIFKRKSENIVSSKKIYKYFLLIFNTVL